MTPSNWGRFPIPVPGSERVGNKGGNRVLVIFTQLEASDARLFATF
jgi:hypothetical protein